MVVAMGNRVRLLMADDSELLLSLQVGFDPHPPMRATGLPSSLASIPGGKP